MTAIDTLSQILDDRYSCRAFRPDPVPDADLARIVEVARHVPSWCNAQPWQVEITRGAGTERLRAALMETARAGTPPAPDLDWPTKYTGDYAERRRTCGFQLYDAVRAGRLDARRGCEGTGPALYRDATATAAPSGLSVRLKLRRADARL